MALFDTLAPALALERLLAREHEALLTGQLAALDRFAQDKDRLAGQLASAGAPRHQLDRLRRMADRNQTLLAAAARGLEAARARIDAIRSGPGPIRTYECNGAASEIAPGRAGGVNRRA